ncbi:anaphase-promoting complex, subunit 10/DOC domain-containing protein [Lipomyces arxii]|uniref:anaphase-promoting complex, subunit 10/DOC domain-containing protein n=1 Tax=Lipomyces arxii TaxID=56418 RepID=UPI0034CD355B
MDADMLTSSEVEGPPISDAIIEDEEDENGEVRSSGEEASEESEFSEDVISIPLRDIGNQATWKLSTWKPGFGVEALLAESTDLYWQSDAPQPHHIDIHFAKRVEIAKIMLYLDCRSDESYTPSQIAVYAGSGYHDLHEVLTMDLKDPVGWIDVSLGHAGKDGFLKAFLVRLSVLQNHQTGKDTHVRGIRVLSPDRQADDMFDEGLPFRTVALLAHSTIR